MTGAKLWNGSNRLMDVKVARHETCRWTDVYSEYVNRRTA